MKHLLAVIVVVCAALGCGGSKAAPPAQPEPASEPAAATGPAPGTCCCTFTEGDRTGQHEMDTDDMEVREHLARVECDKFGMCVEDSVCDEEPEDVDPSMQP